MRPDDDNRPPHVTRGPAGSSSGHEGRHSRRWLRGHHCGHPPCTEVTRSSAGHPRQRHRSVRRANSTPRARERSNAQGAIHRSPPRRHRRRAMIGRAIAIDSDARTVTVGNVSDMGEVTEARVIWDRLVLALGSRPDTRCPGVREHAHTLDVAGSEILAARLPGSPPSALAWSSSAVASRASRRRRRSPSHGPSSTSRS